MALTLLRLRYNFSHALESEFMPCFGCLPDLKQNSRFCTDTIEGVETVFLGTREWSV